MTYFDHETYTATVPGKNAADGTPAVSRLAARMAHELNNPLDAVLRFVSLAQRKARTGDYGDLDRHLADAQFGLERMAEILRELMDIGRDAQDVLTRPRPMPLADLLALSIRMMTAQAQQKRVQIILQNELPAVLSPRYDLRLSQVLANLLKNAVEATGEGTLVTIATTLTSEKTLLLRIEDSGPGIDASLAAQLFIPYTSTKRPGIGHGLGLAISRELVAALGGTLEITNRPAPCQGCAATITLPVL